LGVLVFISLDLDLGLFGNIAAILVFKVFHLPLKYIVYIPIYILFVSGYVYPFLFLPFPFYLIILRLFLSSFLPPISIVVIFAAQKPVSIFSSKKPNLFQSFGPSGNDPLSLRAALASLGRPSGLLRKA